MNCTNKSGVTAANSHPAKITKTLNKFCLNNE